MTIAFVGDGLHARRLWLPLNYKTVLPSGVLFTRAAGRNSVREADPANDVVFIALDKGVDVPRYKRVSYRRGLLIEQAHDNVGWWSNFTDADLNNLPENWTNSGNPKVPGVDLDVSSPGPHGGVYARLLSSAQVEVGLGSANLSALAGTQYTYTIWERADALAAIMTMYAFHLNGGNATYQIPAGTHVWTRRRVTAVTNGIPGAWYMRSADAAKPVGTVGLCLPNLQSGPYPLSEVPTDGAAGTCPLERFRVATALLAGIEDAGRVRLGLFAPEYASTEPAGVHRIISLSMIDYVCFDPADDKVKVYNGGILRAASAALAFAADSEHVIDFGWGPQGTRIGVDGVNVCEATPWVPVPALDFAIGGASDGTLTEGAVYGDLEVWAT